MNEVFPEEMLRDAVCSDDEFNEAKAYGIPFEYEDEGLVCKGYDYDGKRYIASITPAS